jgi:hypothetical protein
MMDGDIIKLEEIIPFAGDNSRETYKEELKTARLLTCQGRLSEIFSGYYLQMRQNPIENSLPFTQEELKTHSKLLKCIRLLHPGVGKRKKIHNIGYIVLRANTGEAGLINEQGRKPWANLVEHDGRPCYFLKCMQEQGCKGGVFITANGNPIIRGIVEVYNGVQWTPCQSLPGCGII